MGTEVAWMGVAPAQSKAGAVSSGLEGLGGSVPVTGPGALPCQAVRGGEGRESEQPPSSVCTPATPLQLSSRLPQSCCASAEVPCREGEDWLNAVSCSSHALSLCFTVGRVRFLCLCLSFYSGAISSFAVDNAGRMRKTLNFSLGFLRFSSILLKDCSFCLVFFFWASFPLSFFLCPIKLFLAGLACVGCPDC